MKKTAEKRLEQLPAVIRSLLRERDVITDQEIENYLFPKLKDLPHPATMKGLADAARVVADTIGSGGDIFIWGDYDVDGTTGTSLLVNFFKQLGVEAGFHIPNRLAEGYGVSADIFDANYTFPVGDNFVFLTVDCGISNSVEVAEIAKAGGQVIVTDHHQIPSGGIPDCIVVNPSQADCGFTHEKLAGVGVAFYLAAAIRKELNDRGFFSELPVPNMKDLLGFVALGTIADLVDLTKTNRILVKAGIESLINNEMPGMQALLERAGIGGDIIVSEDIGFSIGPRINAAGRLGRAEAAVALMTCDNLSEGKKLSERLERYNRERKKLSDNVYERIMERLEANPATTKHSICVEGDYHAGVIGIVASRLVEKFRLPSIVFAREQNEDGETTLKGSGRSIEGVNIVEGLEECSGILDKFGGHEMAAGLTVKHSGFQEFVHRFDRSCSLQLLNNTYHAAGKNELHECAIDEVMGEEVLAYFSLMEPFGPANSKPVFVDKEVQVVSCKAIGADGQHLQLSLRGKYKNHKAIGFGLGDRIAEVRKDRVREIHFTPMLNRFRGRVAWQVSVLSI